MSSARRWWMKFHRKHLCSRGWHAFNTYDGAFVALHWGVLRDTKGNQVRGNLKWTRHCKHCAHREVWRTERPVEA